MDKNKKIYFFCVIHVAVWTVMIFLALIGCAMIFVIANYVKNVMQYANVDVAGVHNKKALEKRLADKKQNQSGEEAKFEALIQE